MSDPLNTTSFEVKEIDGETWVVDNHGHPSARVYASGFAIPEWYEKVQEQARLYAAAPGLLAACQKAQQWIFAAGMSGALNRANGFEAVIEALDTAIARATGEEQ